MLWLIAWQLGYPEVVSGATMGLGDGPGARDGGGLDGLQSERHFWRVKTSRLDVVVESLDEP
jgi:hypothetical protein